MQGLYPGRPVVGGLAELIALQTRSSQPELPAPTPREAREPWVTLRNVFGQLQRDLRQEEVPTRHLFDDIRRAEQVKRTGLLQLWLDSGKAGERPTTLQQALEFVELQRQPRLSWERFKSLLCAAPVSRRPTLHELIVDTGGLPPEWPSSNGRSSSSSAPQRRLQADSVDDSDPDQHPQRAIRWAVERLNVDGSMLRRLHDRFAHCQKVGGFSTKAAAVRRSEYIRSLQSCPGLSAALAVTPLLSAGASGTRLPRIWGDVLLDLNRHESEWLRWSDILEVVRWCRDISLGLVPEGVAGPGGLQGGRAPSPAVSSRAGVAQERIARILGSPTQRAQGDFEPARVSEQRPGGYRAPSPSPLAAPHSLQTSPELPPLPVLGTRDRGPVPRWRSEPEGSTSPVSAVASRMARSVYGTGPYGGQHAECWAGSSPRRQAHPFLDYDLDPVRARPAHRYYDQREAASAALATAMPPPPLSEVSGPQPGRSSPERRTVRVKLQVPGVDPEVFRLGTPPENIEAAMARALGLSPSAVRLRHLNY